MQIQQMREAVIKIGRPGSDWRSKVDHMSDRKVTAIYLRLKAEQKL